MNKIIDTKDNRWVALIVLLTAPLLSVIDVFIINMAIPSIKKGIHATDAELQLVIAAYMLGLAGFLITGGRAGDIYGRKKVFIIGMFLFTLTSCLCGMAQTPFQLNAMRFVQGVSAAFMSPQTISYIQVLFPEVNSRTKALGIFGLTISIAAMLGQLLGGLLPGYHGIVEGWRLIFFINLPIGVTALWFGYRILPTVSITTRQKFDLSGVAILTVTLFSLIYPLTRGRELGWPLWSLALIVISFAMLWLFIKDQIKKLEKGKSPLMNITLFKFRDFNLGLIAGTLYFLVHTSYLLTSTIFLQDGLRMSSAQAGMTFVFYGLGAAISSVLSVNIYMRHGKKVLQLGTIAMTASLMFQFFAFGPELDHSFIMIVLLVQGLGTGMIIPSLLNVALKSIPVEYAGTAAGIYNTIQQTASALGVSLIAGVFFYLINSDDISSYQSAFKYTLIIQVGCLLLLGLTFHLLPEKSTKNRIVALAE